MKAGDLKRLLSERLAPTIKEMCGVEDEDDSEMDVSIASEGYNNSSGALGNTGSKSAHLAPYEKMHLSTRKPNTRDDATYREPDYEKFIGTAEYYDSDPKTQAWLEKCRAARERRMMKVAAAAERAGASPREQMRARHNVPYCDLEADPSRRDTDHAPMAKDRAERNSPESKARRASHGLQWESNKSKILKRLLSERLAPTIKEMCGVEDEGTPDGYMSATSLSENWSDQDYNIPPAEPENPDYMRGFEDGHEAGKISAAMYGEGQLREIYDDFEKRREYLMNKVADAEARKGEFAKKEVDPAAKLKMRKQMLDLDYAHDAWEKDHNHSKDTSVGPAPERTAVTKVGKLTEKNKKGK